MTTRVTTVVVGAGHAGLAASRFLTARSIDHLLLERGEVANSWRRERWDSLRLLTPNFQSRLPGHRYDGSDPDELIKKGFVDTRNMFVYGCSGGGVLTSWIVGHTDRFAAASANCPVTNWMSFVGTTDGSSWYNNFEKYPWEDPTEHLKRSPLMYVGNVKTPTMLMTGVNDLRTPMGQTEEFYQALKVRKVPTAMIRFNDEWHGTSSRPSNYLRTQLYLRSWFEKYTKKANNVAVQ